MKSKEQKLIIVVLLLTALACFLTAIFTLTGGSVSHVEAADSIKTYTVVTNKNDGDKKGFKTVNAPAADATKVTIELVSLSGGGKGRTIGGIVTNGNDNYDKYAGVSSNYFDSTITQAKVQKFTFDLQNKNCSIGTNWFKWEFENANSFGIYMNINTTDPFYGVYQIKAYDDKNTDLGLTGINTLVLPDGVSIKSFNNSNTNAGRGEAIGTQYPISDGASTVTVAYTIKNNGTYPTSFGVFGAIKGEVIGSAFGVSSQDVWVGNWGKEDKTHLIVFNLNDNTIKVDSNNATLTGVDLKDLDNFGINFSGGTGAKFDIDFMAFDDKGKDLGGIGVLGGGWLEKDLNITEPNDETYLTTFSNGDYSLVAGSSSSANYSKYYPVIAGIASEQDGVLHIEKPSTTNGVSNIGFRFGRILTASDIEKGGDLIIRLKYAASNNLLKYCTIDGWNKLSSDKLTYKGATDWNCSGGTHSYDSAKFIDYVIDNETLKTMVDADGELKGLQTSLTTQPDKADLYFDYVRYVVKYDVEFNVDGGSAIDKQNVESGKKVVKPDDPTKRGYVFSGWYTDELFATEFDFDSVITANTTIYAKWLTIEEYLNGKIKFGGASIRINTETPSMTGVRFLTEVDAEVVELLETRKTEGEIIDYSFGTLIVATDLIDSAPTIDNLDQIHHYDVKSTGFYKETTSYYASIIVKASNYDREWSSRGYVALTLENNETVYVYNEFDMDDSRSIYEVALLAYNDQTLDLDDDQIAILKGYINSVVFISSEGVLVDKGVDYEEDTIYNVSKENDNIIITVIDEYAVISSVVIDGAWVNAVISNNGKTATVNLKS